MAEHNIVAFEKTRPEETDFISFLSKLNEGVIAPFPLFWGEKASFDKIHLQPRSYSDHGVSEALCIVPIVSAEPTGGHCRNAMLQIAGYPKNTTGQLEIIQTSDRGRISYDIRLSYPRTSDVLAQIPFFGELVECVFSNSFAPISVANVRLSSFNPDVASNSLKEQLTVKASFWGAMNELCGKRQDLWGCGAHIAMDKATYGRGGDYEFRSEYSQILVPISTGNKITGCISLSEYIDGTTSVQLIKKGQHLSSEIVASAISEEKYRDNAYKALPELARSLRQQLIKDAPNL